MDSQASQQASPRNARQHLGGFLDATLEWPYVIVKNPEKRHGRENLPLLSSDAGLTRPQTSDLGPRTLKSRTTACTNAGMVASSAVAVIGKPWAVIVAAVCGPIA